MFAGMAFQSLVTLPLKKCLRFSSEPVLIVKFRG
jgi:hypothetical protein